MLICNADLLNIVGALTATFSLTVSVTDVNDVAPNCSQKVYAASVDENLAANHVVTTIVCEDHDSTSPNNVVANYTSNDSSKCLRICFMTCKLPVLRLVIHVVMIHDSQCF